MVCNIQSGGTLDNLVTQFGNVAATWQTQINPIAQRIFFILFGMEFMWQLVVRKIFAGDIEKLWVFFFTRVVLCFFFAKYIVNVALYEQIIEYFAHLGSKLSGYSLSLTPGNNFSSMGPSEIMGNFACVSDVVHQITDSTGSLDYLTLKISLAIMQVMLFVVLALFAFYIIKVFLQAYFILYAGFILTGFAGSSWTRTFWERYIQAVAGIAIKFLTVCFLLGILTTQMKLWAVDINAAKDVVELGGIVAKVVCSAIIMALLSHQLPEWAASSLAGNVNMQFASQLLSAVNSFGSGLKNVHSTIQNKRNN